MKNENKARLSNYFSTLKASKEELVEIRIKIKERRAEIDTEFSERAKKIRRRI